MRQPLRDLPRRLSAQRGEVPALELAPGRHAAAQAGARSVAVDARHLIGIDALRFLAAAYVALYHLGYWSWAFEPGMTARAARHAVAFEPLAPVAAYGWIGVQIFFVISGFVIAFSAEGASWFGFLVSRVVRLAPCVWIVASLTCVASLALGVGGAAGLADRWLRSVLFHPWSPWVDSVYWSLGVEIVFYAFVLLLIRLRRFSALPVAMACIGLASTAFWAAWWLVGAGPGAALLHRLQASRGLELLLLHHGCFFALGVYFWLQLLKAPRAGRWLLMAGFGLGCLLQIAANADLNGRKTGIAVSALTPLLVFVAAMAALFALVRANARLRRVLAPQLAALRTVGLMTFPLYLMHNVAGATLLGWLVTHGLDQRLALGSVLALALAASYVVAVHLEPPLQRWTRQALLRLRPAIEPR